MLLSHHNCICDYNSVISKVYVYKFYLFKMVYTWPIFLSLSHICKSTTPLPFFLNFQYLLLQCILSLHACRRAQYTEHAICHCSNTWICNKQQCGPSIIQQCLLLYRMGNSLFMYNTNLATLYHSKTTSNNLFQNLAAIMDRVRYEFT